ncbi:ABC transporter ATP-binding protein [Halobacteriales archaeon QS_4_69_225]|nr:MAG: ABC transporter ATP-binding protein [Halobacteriales archaeon QS_4_69_225]
MSEDEIGDVPRREKIHALFDVAKFNPKFTVLIVVLGLGAAVLEGIGLGFILPIIEIVQSENPAAEASGFLGVFVTVYRTLGIPFALQFVIVGVALVMTVRYTLSFMVAWFREALRTYYTRDLQIRAFDDALDAKVEYYDQEGSDDILNAIITQTFYAGRVIMRVVKFIEQAFLSVVYLLIALVVAPVLTLYTSVVLGGITVLMRQVIEPGYNLGDKVADANEQRQAAAQAGTQGIRDIRIFGVADELFDDFVGAVNKYTGARISLRRNEAAIQKFYNLLVSVSVFALIYFALTFANLSISSLAVFLFAMFRLGPRVSNLNQMFYRIENDLPHLVRTQEFIQTLEQYEEPNATAGNVPAEIKHVEFDDVRFSYDGEENVLQGIDFEVEQSEYIAFVGESGAGKSTIVSLLARLYQQYDGDIRANGVPIDDMDIGEWRDRITVVRQNPFIFDDTLEYNLTIGNRDAADREIERVCEIARVDEFLDDLPKGYDTLLGDDGVRLSGGQKQRVALARALLEDADLLILDEATSDLDSNLEKEVQQAIEGMDREYAIIAIAHRLSTVENADCIYTVEDGRISEYGSHSDLLSKDGTYAELYGIQS